MTQTSLVTNCLEVKMKEGRTATVTGANPLLLVAEAGWIIVHEQGHADGVFGPGLFGFSGESADYWKCLPNTSGSATRPRNGTVVFSELPK